MSENPGDAQPDHESPLDTPDAYDDAAIIAAEQGGPDTHDDAAPDPADDALFGPDGPPVTLDCDGGGMAEVSTEAADTTADPDRMGAAPWRIAGSILTLLAEVNAAYPRRSKASDGTIGDAAHRREGSASDHNPWVSVGGIGVVRAVDITSATIPAENLADHFRALGKASDPRVTNGGYVIYNRRIAAPSSGWNWVRYTGSSPHTEHIHLSVTVNRSYFDRRGPWGISHAGSVVSRDAGTGRAPVVQGPYPWRGTVLRRGSTGGAVRAVQTRLMTQYRYRLTHGADGTYGDETFRAVRDFQKQHRLATDGVVGPQTWARLFPNNR